MNILNYFQYFPDISVCIPQSFPFLDILILVFLPTWKTLDQSSSSLSFTVLNVGNCSVLIVAILVGSFLPPMASVVFTLAAL